MANTWVNLFIRVRPDQKIGLEKRHPTDLAPAMRDLIDSYLDSCKPDDVMLEELDKEIGVCDSKLASLKTQKKQLLEKQEKRKSNLEFENLRKNYLKDHPRILLDFDKNMVTTTGYDTIRYKLRFNSVKELKLWLNEKLTEAKKSPDWEKHLTDLVNQQNGLKCFSQITHKPKAVQPEKFGNKKDDIL